MTNRDEADKVLKEINRLRFMLTTHLSIISTIVTYLNELDDQVVKLQILFKEQSNGE